MEIIGTYYQEQEKEFLISKIKSHDAMLAEIYQHQESLHSCEPHEYFLHLLQFVNASMALLLARTHGVVVVAVCVQSVSSF